MTLDEPDTMPKIGITSLIPTSDQLLRASQEAQKKNQVKQK
jgi:hypothetical protein